MRVYPVFTFATLVLNVWFQCHSPKATLVISPGDKDIIATGGVAVVECSWARIEEIPWHKISSPHERLRA